MQKGTLKDNLKNILPQKELELLNKSFEIVGDIAIIEIPKELKKYEPIIGKTIMQINTHIKTVLKKSGIHKGEFRTQKLKHIAGDKKKETTYLENGIKLKINPETVYFSAKLSTERAKLMQNLEKNKRILIMFSGAGPYTFTAIKKQPDLQRLDSIEINPHGHKYALENLELNKNLIKKSQTYQKALNFLKENKLKINEKELVNIFNTLKIHFLKGDVKKIIPKLKLKEHKQKIKKYDNDLFKQDITQTHTNLSNLKKKELKLNLNDLKNQTNLSTLLSLFSKKFNYVCTIKNKTYKFNTPLLKSYLITHIETQIPIEKINLYDKIFMPLPKDAPAFLKEAFEIADQNATIHMYDFVHQNEFPKLTEKKVKKAAQDKGIKIKILSTRKVGQYSPRKYRACCDFKIL